MKCLKIFLLLALVLSILPCMQSAEDLNSILETLKKERPYLLNNCYPELPTKEHLIEIENALQTTLPDSLKIYQLTLGNLCFATDMPTAFGGKSSLLYNLIRDGEEVGIPNTVVSFSEDGGDYYCMELRTGKVFHYTVIPKLEHHATYDNLSTFIQQVLLDK